MRAVWAMALKDIRLLLRDRMGCFFALVFPLCIAIFFGSIFGGGGGGKGIQVAVVDEDLTPGSSAYIAALKDGDELVVKTEIATAGPDEVTSQQPLTRETATNLVRRGKLDAYIIITKGFGKARDNIFSGNSMRLEVGVDPARKAAVGMLEGVLTKYAFERMAESFADPKKMREEAKTSLAEIQKSPTTNPLLKPAAERFFGTLDGFLAVMPDSSTSDAATGENAGANGVVGVGGVGGGGWQPVKIETSAVLPDGPVIKNAYAITFPQGIIWGVMGCAQSFGLSMAMERSKGTLVRLRAAPIRRWQVLAGKALACFLFTIAICALLLLLARFGFGVVPTSLPLVALAVVSIAICFVGIMMLLAVAGKTERGSGGLAWGIMLLLSMIGGGMIPLEFMPGWMKTISVISPIRWSISALEAGVWRGLGIADIALPVVILVAIGIVGFMLGLRAYAMNESD